MAATTAKIESLQALGSSEHEAVAALETREATLLAAEGTAAEEAARVLAAYEADELVVHQLSAVQAEYQGGLAAERRKSCAAPDAGSAAAEGEGGAAADSVPTLQALLGKTHELATARLSQTETCSTALGQRRQEHVAAVQAATDKRTEQLIGVRAERKALEVRARPPPGGAL